MMREVANCKQINAPKLDYKQEKRYQITSLNLFLTMYLFSISTDEHVPL